MQERDSHQENLSSEISPFPLTEESVKRSLEEITKDPLSEFISTIKLLESENHNVFRLVKAAFKTHKNNIGILEGGVLAYKIIKDSIFEGKDTMPILKNNLGDFFISNFYKENEEVDNLIKRKTDEIRHDDPFFIDAIQQMSRYRIDSKRFCYGAIVVYSAIKYSEKYQ
ncbi:hypothetical protein SDC9_127553 [bioreactor metagenome]|uniref:Uncharacterized protein n=1 Tax=bioreactor metagenome TaxID=1076179 RepID=A0A645CTS0_9ZZZZ